MNYLSFENEFIRKHPNRVNILKLMRNAIGVREVTWKDITSVNLVNVRETFNKEVEGNSPRTYIAILKAFLSPFVDEGIVPCKNIDKYLWAKQVPSEQVVLTADEISLIESYKPRSKNEKCVKAQFLCEYYCFARSSDINNLTEENIKDGYIVYVSQKTKVRTEVPLHKNFLKYFRERGENIGRSTYNRTIKRICKNVGITDNVSLFYHGKWKTCPKYELVGSHTARRSGATELAKRDVPISTISKLMNHKDTITTSRYIFADTRNLGEAAMDFFNGR